jgi:hypothetical protein
MASGFQDVKVRVSRSGMTAGDYQSAIQITSNGGTITVPVAVKVPVSPPPPTAAAISVNPASLTFGLTVTELSLQIKNTGSSLLDWAAQSSSGWATVSVSGGSLAPSGTQDVKVRVSRAGLTAGSYQGAIQLTSNGGSVTVPVALQVPTSATPAKISITPVSLSFGLTATELSFKIQNTGGSPLDWSAQTNTGWASLPISTGQVVASGFQDVKVRVSRSGLTAGDYQSAIQVTSNGGSATVATSLRVPVPPPTGSSTVNVRDFGAKGDGVTDDSYAIKAAISALPGTGGTVMIPAGTYIVSSINVGPFRPIDLSRDNVTITGDGMDSTVLKMAPGSYPTAAFMILVNRTSGNTIKNLTLDMNVTASGGTFYSDEQSHGIRVVSSSDIRIDGVRFRNTPGDGIYLLGLAEAGDPWTERVVIENSHFTKTWRNGITIQRAVRNLQIRRNTFDEISQQSISSEPSGNNAPTDIIIEDNVIRHWSQTSSYTIAISGTRPSDRLRRLVFRRNQVEGGYVYFLWTDDLEISNNTINGGPYKSALRLQDVSNSTVSNNVITGLKQNESGVVQILNEDYELSSNILLNDNKIDVGPGLTAIYVRDASGNITLSNNKLSGWGGGYGIQFANLITTGTPRSGFYAVGNIVNNFANGIGFLVRGEPFSDVRVRSNVIDDASPATGTTGILFDGTGPYESFAEVDLNTFGSGVATPIRVR